MTHRIKAVIGAGLIAAAIGGIWFWETYGRERWTYEEVLVLREPTERNVSIDVSHLAVRSVEKDKLIAGCITNPEEVIGKETTQYIPAGTFLVAEYFDEPELRAGDDQYIFAIPNDWIEAYPQSLRRRDTVSIYPVREQNGEEVIETTAAIEDVPLFSAVVAYAKNNSNQEVESLDPSRLGGTGKVSLVEIVATMGQVDQMRIAAESGCKFILLYQ